jgi:hypothetical protein
MTTQAQPLNEFHFETLDELMADTPHQRNHAQHIVDTIHRTLWLKEQFKGRSEHDVLTYVETNGDGAERGAKLGTTVRKSLGEGSFGGLRPIETCFATSFYVSTDKGSLDFLSGVLIWFADQFSQCSLSWRLCWVVLLCRHRRVR